MKKTSGDTVKTNAMRQLEVAGISYRTASYEYDESNLSGLHAAEQVGIPDQRYFSTMFKKYYGCSPKQYKQNMKRKGI